MLTTETIETMKTYMERYVKCSETQDATRQCATPCGECPYDIPADVFVQFRYITNGIQSRQ